ncbi:hypothetical protein EVAR_91987_1 [Eumeta japonica]|uniref:Uncharacterized protein n=1 Tax=Eumeta variegata TaxID=151549 RepID=A0A4C2AD80_EUMVA|nr:hypothetical protein EVAR_91987_1 [Eumeta japonica]
MGPDKENVADDATRDAPSNLNQRSQMVSRPAILIRRRRLAYGRVTPTVETGEEQVEYCSLSTCAAGESIYAARHKRTRKNEDEPAWKPSHKVSARVPRTAGSAEQKKTAIRPLPAEYELAAEQLLTKAAQMDSFEEDIKRLMKGASRGERKQTPWPKRDDGSRDDKIKYAHKQSRRCRRDD